MQRPTGESSIWTHFMKQLVTRKVKFMFKTPNNVVMRPMHDLSHFGQEIGKLPVKKIVAWLVNNWLVETVSMLPGLSLYDDNGTHTNCENFFAKLDGNPSHVTEFVDGWLRRMLGLVVHIPCDKLSGREDPNHVIQSIIQTVMKKSNPTSRFSIEDFVQHLCNQRNKRGEGVHRHRRIILFLEDCDSALDAALRKFIDEIIEIAKAKDEDFLILTTSNALLWETSDPPSHTMKLNIRARGHHFRELLRRNGICERVRGSTTPIRITPPSHDVAMSVIDEAIDQSTVELLCSAIESEFSFVKKNFCIFQFESNRVAAFEDSRLQSDASGASSTSTPSIIDQLSTAKYAAGKEVGGADGCAGGGIGRGWVGGPLPFIGRNADASMVQPGESVDVGAMEEKLMSPTTLPKMLQDGNEHTSSKLEKEKEDAEVEKDCTGDQMDEDLPSKPRSVKGPRTSPLPRATSESMLPSASAIGKATMSDTYFEVGVQASVTDRGFLEAQDYVLRMAECGASPEAGITRFRLIDSHSRDSVMVEVTRRGADKILGHVGAEGEIRARVSYDHFAHVHLEQSGGRLLGDYVVAPVVSLWAGGVVFEEGDVKLVLPSNLSTDNDVSEVLGRVGVMTCGDSSEWSEGEERREEVWKSYPSVEDGLEGRGLEVELRDEMLYFKIALKHFCDWTIVTGLLLTPVVALVVYYRHLSPALGNGSTVGRWSDVDEENQMQAASDGSCDSRMVSSNEVDYSFMSAPQSHCAVPTSEGPQGTLSPAAELVTPQVRSEPPSSSLALVALDKDQIYHLLRDDKKFGGRLATKMKNLRLDGETLARYKGKNDFVKKLKEHAASEEIILSDVDLEGLYPKIQKWVREGVLEDDLAWRPSNVDTWRSSNVDTWRSSNVDRAALIVQQQDSPPSVVKRCFTVKVFGIFDSRKSQRDYIVIYEAIGTERKCFAEESLEPTTTYFEERLGDFASPCDQHFKVLYFGGHGASLPSPTGSRGPQTFLFTDASGNRYPMNDTLFQLRLCAFKMGCIVMNWCGSYDMAASIRTHENLTDTFLVSWRGDAVGDVCQHFAKFFFRTLVSCEGWYSPRESVILAFREACNEVCANRKYAVKKCIDNKASMMLMMGGIDLAESDFEERLKLMGVIERGLDNDEHGARNWYPNAPNEYGQREIDILKLLWTTRGTQGLPCPGGGELQEVVGVDPNVVPPGYIQDPEKPPTLWLVDDTTVEHWFALLGMPPRWTYQYLGDVFGPQPRFQHNRNVIVFKLARDRLNDADGHGRELVLRAHELLFRVCEERERALRTGGRHANSHAHAFDCMVMQYNTIAINLLGLEDTYERRQQRQQGQEEGRMRDSEAAQAQDAQFGPR